MLTSDWNTIPIAVDSSLTKIKSGGLILTVHYKAEKIRFRLHLLILVFEYKDKFIPSCSHDDRFLEAAFPEILKFTPFTQYETEFQEDCYEFSKHPKKVIYLNF